MYALYRSVAKLFHEPVVPKGVDPRSTRALGWTDEMLVEGRRAARYYAVSNGIRAYAYLGLMVPAMILHHEHPAQLLAMLGIFHLMNVSLELYKFNIFSRHLKASEALGVHEPAGTLVKPAAAKTKPIRILPGETVQIYEALGMEAFRRFMVEYVEWAKISRAERQAGARPTFAGYRGSDMQMYASNTVISEVIHFAGSFLNLLAVWLLFQDRMIYAGVLILFGVLFDFAVALLQRYHRLRIHQILAQRNRRAAR